MTQTEALEIMLSGRNVFLTGPPGSGKSYVIESFINQVSKIKKIALTATTGISASLIGGITIHSWAAMGITKPDISNISDQLKERVLGTDILIIDEISMLGSESLMYLNQLLKTIRKNNRAFGGIQVILSGDFFQLPPISSSQSYAFESSSWMELNLAICYLSEQHRQRQDELFELLCALREKSFERRHLDLLLSRRLTNNDKEITNLLTHNSEVDKINKLRLSFLGGISRSYSMRSIGKADTLNLLKKSILAPETLNIKVGAKVMFVANNMEQGYVNGSQGRVVGYKKGWPIVRLEGSDTLITVEAHKWRYEQDNKLQAEIYQLPLKLSWAITIHKCQGMSLDTAVVDLTRSFTYGMGYVALSRLKSYNGLYLKGINTRSLLLDPKVYDFDKSIRARQIVRHKSNRDDQEIKALLDAGATRAFIKLSLGVSNRRLNEYNNYSS